MPEEAMEILDAGANIHTRQSPGDDSLWEKRNRAKFSARISRAGNILGAEQKACS